MVYLKKIVMCSIDSSPLYRTTYSEDFLLWCGKGKKRNALIQAVPTYERATGMPAKLVTGVLGVIISTDQTDLCTPLITLPDYAKKARISAAEIQRDFDSPQLSSLSVEKFYPIEANTDTFITMAELSYIFANNNIDKLTILEDNIEMGTADIVCDTEYTNRLQSIYLDIAPETMQLMKPDFFIAELAVPEPLNHAVADKVEPYNTVWKFRKG